MNFSIWIGFLEYLVIMQIFFAMQWYWVIRMWKKWRGSQQVPTLHGI